MPQHSIKLYIVRLQMMYHLKSKQVNVCHLFLEVRSQLSGNDETICIGTAEKRQDTFTSAFLISRPYIFITIQFHLWPLGGQMLFLFSALQPLVLKGSFPNSHQIFIGPCSRPQYIFITNQLHLWPLRVANSFFTLCTLQGRVFNQSSF